MVVTLNWSPPSNESVLLPFRMVEPKKDDARRARDVPRQAQPCKIDLRFVKIGIDEQDCNDTCIYDNYGSDTLSFRPRLALGFQFAIYSF